MRDRKELIDLAKKFYEANQQIEKLYEAAEKIIIPLYSDSHNPSNSLADLRLKLFYKTVAKSRKGIQLNVLPPTESALVQHVKRVYFQIQAWLGINLNPEQWGWKRTKFILIPIMMDSPAAPETLLQQVYIK